MTDTITVWRLNTRPYTRSALSGDGAAKFGGRWNLPGTRVVYCSESRALAALEILVHVDDVELLSDVTWVATAIALPAADLQLPAKYPTGWAGYPYSIATQEFGSAWAASRRSLGLRVPSAVIRGEFNFLLNPAHPQFSKLEIRRSGIFRFDSRLKKSRSTGAR